MYSQDISPESSIQLVLKSGNYSLKNIYVNKHKFVNTYISLEYFLEIEKYLRIELYALDILL